MDILKVCEKLGISIGDANRVKRVKSRYQYGLNQNGRSVSIPSPVYEAWVDRMKQEKYKKIAEDIHKYIPDW